MMGDLLKRLYRWLGLDSPDQRVLALSDWSQPPVQNPVAPSPVEPRPREVTPEARRKMLFAAFNPSRPVEMPADLAGRGEELSTLVSSVIDEHTHAVIHGARGSGKTSLVRVFGTQADQRGIVTVYLACDATSSFSALIGPYLSFVPDTVVPFDRERAFRRALEGLQGDFGPRELVSVLAEITRGRLVFILDEFDRITDRKLQEDVATFMKLLSDAHVPLQLLLVGIAGNVRELIGLHASLRRHLVAVGIQRIGVESVRALISRGSVRCGITFDEAAVSLIERTAVGSPYHVRLFCHHAGLAALAREQTVVDESLAFLGLQAAFDRWAALNEEDSALFEHLAQESNARPVLYRIAAQAAADDGLVAGEDTPSELNDALVDDGREVGRTLFRDSLAPQFLIATLVLAEYRQVKVPSTLGDPL